MATIEISQLVEQLSSLHLPEDAHRSLAVVVPLAEGKAEIVREFLTEGPPFDPDEVGFERHQVFVTDCEAIFVFETAEGMKTFQRLASEPELWELISSWERCACAAPRAASAIYEWPEA